jgi:hypothetical protein
MVFLYSILANKNLFTYLLRLLVEAVHVSLVAVDAEKLTTTSRRPPHKKLHQETQSTAAFLSLPPRLGATAVSGEATRGLGFEPPLACLQNNSWDSYKTAEKFFGRGWGTPLPCFSLLDIVTV